VEDIHGIYHNHGGKFIESYANDIGKISRPRMFIWPTQWLQEFYHVPFNVHMSEEQIHAQRLWMIWTENL